MKRFLSTAILVCILISTFALPALASTSGAALEECVESQKNPEWLITELCANTKGDGTIPGYGSVFQHNDAFEFIELYNNSDVPLNLYDYALAYNGQERSHESFENKIFEVTPFLHDNTWEDKPGNYLDGDLAYDTLTNGYTVKKSYSDVEYELFSKIHESLKNPKECLVEPGECVVLWAIWDESYYNCYHSSAEGNLDGHSMTVEDFRSFWNVPEDVKVILFDASATVDVHNFNMKNSGCATYSVVKYKGNEELLNKNCNTFQDNGKAAAGLEMVYSQSDILSCWASVDTTNNAPAASTVNYTINFVPDLGGYSAKEFGYVWSGARMTPLESAAEPSLGRLTDLQKLYIAPETLEVGTTVKLSGNNIKNYVYAPFPPNTQTERYTFRGFSINGETYGWENDSFIVPTDGVKSFELYYEVTSLTTEPEDDDVTTAPSQDDVTTAPSQDDATVTTTPDAADATLAPDITTATPTEPVEESGCGGIAAAAQAIALICGILGIALVGKAK